MPNPREVAELEVRGVHFKEWESVWVQHRMGEAYALFRFTAAEIERPVPNVWDKLQFKPGDPCTVILGGQLGVTGYITERQVGYDAKNHQIQLQGKGLSHWPYKSSVIHDTFNFDNKTFEQIAREVLAPHNIAVEIKGVLDSKPFEKMQCPPGTTIWDFLEQIARPKGIIVSSNKEGAIVLIGEHSDPLVDNLIEGVNILKCQYVISDQNVFKKYIVFASKPAGKDEDRGGQSNQVRAEADGTAVKKSDLLTPGEQPMDEAEAKKRAEFEKQWHEGPKYDLTIVVQGWLRGNTSALWQIGDNVRVKSPMCPLDNVFKIQTATFTQDRNSGTLTTLDLKPPWYLNDRIPIGFGPGGETMKPGEAVGATNSLPSTETLANELIKLGQQRLKGQQ